MVLLRALDRADFSAADSAYYALLFTQAQIKTDVYLTSDSLIAPALDAYRFSSDPDLRRRAHFYAAQVAYYAGDLTKAMRNIVVAYDIAQKDNNPYWIAKCAELISDIYTDTYNYPQVEKYRLEAISCYGRAGLIRNQRFSMCDLASNYVNLGECDRGLAILDSISCLARQEVPNDTNLDSYAEKILMDLVMQVQDYDMLEQLIANHKRTFSLEDKLTHEIYSSLVESYRGNTDIADSYLLNAYNISDSKRDSIRVLYSNYLTAKKCGDYHKAISLTDSLLNEQSAIVKDILFDAVSSIPKEFYAEQAAQQRKRSQLFQVYFWSATVVALIILAMSILLYRQRMRTKRAEYESNLANTMATLMQIQNQATEAQNNVEKLIKEKSSIISQLCEEYFKLGQTEKAHKRIISQLDDELNKLRTPETIAELETTNDRYIGGIIRSAREQCTFLSQNDLQFLSLLLNKYPVRTVCFVLDIKYNNFYQKKYRICKKIEASSIPIKDELLKRLNAQS